MSYVQWNNIKPTCPICKKEIREEQYAFHLILFFIIKEISNRKKIKARNGSEDYIMNDLLIIILPIFIKILRN